MWKPLFIPCHTTINKKETVQLVFKHVICEYGIPRQIISDRDIRWRGDFWKETCQLLGTERAPTTAYHPQADGQTEVLNQGLEIALRAYVGPTRDDWANHLPALSLSYNTSPHSSTGFQPAFLLRGYVSTTSSTFLTDPGPDPHFKDQLESLHPEATHLVAKLQACRTEARDALILAQARDLGPTSFLLGIEIIRDRPHRSISISQRQYIVDMLDRFGFSGCTPVQTPMQPGLRLSEEMCPSTASERTAMSKLPYINAVGALC